MPTETPDLPCPKCGSQRTEMIYCNDVAGYRQRYEGYQKLAAELAQRLPEKHRVPWLPPRLPGYRDGAGRERYCLGPDSGHFHRGCLRCEYRWITEDVVTG